MAKLTFKVAPYLRYDDARRPLNPYQLPFPDGFKLVFRRTLARKVEHKLTGMELLYDMAEWTKVQEGRDPYMGWPQDWAQSHQAINHYLGT